MTIIDEAGSKQADLNLFDKDYLDFIKAQKGVSTPDPAQYLQRIWIAAQYVSYGKNLLVVPVSTALPILEVTESGILRAVSLQLPKGVVIGSMLPSDGRNWLLEVATIKDGAAAFSSDRAVAMYTNPEVQEFTPEDGKQMRSIEVSGGLYAVCQHGGDFLFLTTRPEDGKLQIIKGSPKR